MAEADEKITPEQVATRLEQSDTELWRTISLLDEGEVESARLAAGWSPKALVAHVAFWDDYQTRRLQAVLAGQVGPEGFPRAEQDNDQRAVLDEKRDWTQIADEADAARKRIIAFTRALSQDDFYREAADGSRTITPVARLEHMVTHTRDHTKEIFEYCGSMTRWTRDGLRRFMAEQQENLMSGIGGLTETTMLTTKLDGEWTIRDVLTHVLSWQECAAKMLAQWPTPKPESIAEWDFQPGDTMNAMNARLMAARSQLDPISIADGLSTEYRRILRSFDAFSDADLSSRGRTWSGEGVLSLFIFDAFSHITEHAEMLWEYRAGEG
jgi:uncharacterized damage-inducible protein DinB